MRQVRFSILLAFTALMLLGASSQAQQAPFSFVAFGDMPYNLPEDYGRFENLIRDVNKQNQVFNVHVGDIKSSENDCSDAYYQKIHGYFNQFDKPLIYIPGDNEWTDCNKHTPGKYNIDERLSTIRKLFFDGQSSLGKSKLLMISQAKHPEFAKYVENNRWQYGNVQFGTVHIVGTNNNFYPNPKGDNAEFYDRNKANLAWIDEVFDQAKASNAIAVVLFTQADMYNSAKDAKEANAFTTLKDKLQARTVDFKKPVLLVNGDSHIFLVDKPLYVKGGKGKKDLDNFTRLQTFGEDNIHAVKVTINPATPGLFQIEPLMVQGN
ncbi:metallophosphoesterase [Spirosoma endbachense]|uniref:Metallophosphoesterase n=1 Tax=Spirosoma endbachense TaxID=2666025 RepID=A0A6P1VQL1_9BACT|nr:metallophosphoesterase [Spirosoma endbachense]QHV95383.1 metallophosphoesterase [Spirosoma endbachense]